MTNLIPFKTEITQPDIYNAEQYPRGSDRWVETQYYQLNYLWEKIIDLSKGRYDYCWRCPALLTTFYIYPSLKFEEIKILFEKTETYESGGITAKEAPFAFADILKLLEFEKKLCKVFNGLKRN